MGVYIKGLTIPEMADNTSIKMELRKLDGVVTIGIMTGGYSCAEQWNYYLIAKIPEPHGRLVDANFMREALGAGCIARRDSNGDLIALASIEMLPTVIEAEGEK